MLAAHNEPGSVARNLHGLAYRYEGNFNSTPEQNSYKILAELSIPNPGTSLRNDPL
jgi:hypothetical protein